MKTYFTIHTIAQRQDGKFIVLQRAKDRSSPGKWNCVTGFIQERESAEEAALRELKEETNLEGNIIKTTEPFWKDIDSTRWVVVSSLVEVADISTLGVDERESQDHRWIDIDDDIVSKSDALRTSLIKLGLLSV